MPWTYPKSQPSRGTTFLVVSLHVVELLLLILEAGGLFSPFFASKNLFAIFMPRLFCKFYADVERLGFH